MEAITAYIENTLKDGGTTDNRKIRSVCEQNGIDLDTNISKVKEAVEIGLMHLARSIAQSDKTLRQKYDELIDLYNRQPYVGTKKTLKQMVLQQYSTPLPIAFLMSEFVKGQSNSSLYFEPSAGNGFLTIALPQENTICNEIDRYRLENLKNEHYRKVSEQDARQPFEYNRIFDGVVTNPPFLKGQETNTMIFNALETMKDSGRCAILRDGNAQFTDYAGTKLRSSFTGFYDRLFQEYNVVKIININAKKIYAKQGTSFFMHIILINGRRAKKLSDNDSMHRVYNPDIDKIDLAGFEELWEYFSPYFTEIKDTKSVIERVDTVAKIKLPFLFIRDNSADDGGERINYNLQRVNIIRLDVNALLVSNNKEEKFIASFNELIPLCDIPNKYEIGQYVQVPPFHESYGSLPMSVKIEFCYYKKSGIYGDGVYYIVSFQRRQQSSYHIFHTATIYFEVAEKTIISKPRIQIKKCSPILSLELQLLKIQATQIAGLDGLTAEQWQNYLAQNEDWISLNIKYSETEYHNNVITIQKPTASFANYRGGEDGYIHYWFHCKKDEIDEKIKVIDKVFNIIIDKFPEWKTENPIISYRPRKDTYHEGYYSVIRELRFTKKENEKFLQVIPFFLKMLAITHEQIHFNAEYVKTLNYCKFQAVAEKVSDLAKTEAKLLEDVSLSERIRLNFTDAPKNVLKELQTVSNLFDNNRQFTEKQLKALNIKDVMWECLSEYPYDKQTVDYILQKRKDSKDKMLPKWVNIIYNYLCEKYGVKKNPDNW